MDFRDLTQSELKKFVDYDDHEIVRRFEDAETGLVAYIAVHNTALGPALGGCRMYPYESEDDAIFDVLRLSKGMTYKNALAGLPLGGGKSVIIGNARTIKNDALMAAMGRAVQSLGGRYITAEDSGTNTHDMGVIASETEYVMGREGNRKGVLGGDPSPFTAYGVYCGIKATAEYYDGSDDLKDKIVAVQGLGAVGYELCRLLDKDGAKLVVTDINEEVLKKAKAQFSDVDIVAPDAIFAAPCDIFAPCAMGAQINEKTIAQLRAKMIAGAANNQIATIADEISLMERGIAYAPDYAINAAGVIAVCYEYLEMTGDNPFDHAINRDNMMAHIQKIGDVLHKIFKIADDRGIFSARAADELAEDIFKNHNTLRTAVHG